MTMARDNQQLPPLGRPARGAYGEGSSTLEGNDTRVAPGIVPTHETLLGYWDKARAAAGIVKGSTADRQGQLLGWYMISAFVHELRAAPPSDKVAVADALSQEATADLAACIGAQFEDISGLTLPQETALGMARAMFQDPGDLPPNPDGDRITDFTAGLRESAPPGSLGGLDGDDAELSELESELGITPATGNRTPTVLDRQTESVYVP